ncbi:flavin-dependent oxidoreductase [Polaromonas sp. JS666]|uniref:flavin-dependent oxidoreductase n=1 Tax=Polaromonas sp. (strain JS666 / ATCC BAA-500) TaxID=296591 RepID=UPI000053735D|nr:flavin-dependent oxidoreductase [Polaromonas sp. JS666]ABE44126.1 monooxygenase, FAD-binding protein [Polaromonas sp. JS666]
MKIAIVGGGIGGLSLALAVKQRGLACDVFETVPEVREVGVGITLLPHAMRELAALGLQPQLEAAGIENEESVFFNRFGQFIYKEPRGRHAGYDLPEIGIPRGKLHRLLYEAALERLGSGAVHTDHRCTGVDQDDSGATVHFTQTSSGADLPSRRADVVIACDGVNSTVRRQFYPDEKVAFAGINTWRGVTRHQPILTGKSYLRVGSLHTGKMVIYPIVDRVDDEGTQLINWVAEIRRDNAAMNDWNRPGDLKDFLDIFKDWRFPWLDVAALITSAGQILEYPMVDKDPVPQWTFGRVTLLGDAAHPMYPRGSNGSAQALIDARVLAEQLAAHAGGDARAALQAYEELRLAPTAQLVLTNRSVPPDFINIKVDELSGGKPFANIDELISQQELRRISEYYKKVAGFSLDMPKAG